MKERPVLFSSSMVRAILAGQKTQTRRVIAPQPTSAPRWNAIVLRGYGGWTDAHGSPTPCKYGVPGDRLWVRETFCVPLFDPVLDRALGSAVMYRADCTDAQLSEERSIRRVARRLASEMPFGAWKPSIFMPRWASRITLEVTDVRAQRVQEIACHDIRAEGVSCPEHDFPGGFCCSECPFLRDAFRDLWGSINGKREGCSWDANPWVWAISFKVLKEDSR